MQNDYLYLSRHWSQAHDASEPEWIRVRSARILDRWARSVSRITVPLVSHFDWDRLRVNVFHHVAPELVKWQ